MMELQDVKTYSICALSNLSIEQITAHINLNTGENWALSKNDFPDGNKNGCVCYSLPDRKHYLFEKI